MYSPTDLLFVIVGTALITALIVAVLIRNVTSYPREVIYVSPTQPSDDAGSGCLAILILLGLMVFIVFTFSS
ncbi:MAG: hypothetical protein RMK84_02100 [Oscillochloridaceae bacterium]|nr:hypothetical protein [Chloroflexaceae bacterium]MDW8388894.1 hypothetical protein [Oscillochloridaceae bacterium]